MAGAAVVVMPSAYESLSLSVLEAWALGRPVLVNAECRVLEGQCVRSNGGLFYRGYAEFAPALRMLVERSDLQEGLGAAGRAYVAREYDWDIVERRGIVPGADCPPGSAPSPRSGRALLRLRHRQLCPAIQCHCAAQGSSRISRRPDPRCLACPSVVESPGLLAETVCCSIFVGSRGRRSQAPDRLACIYHTSAADFFLGSTRTCRPLLSRPPRAWDFAPRPEKLGPGTASHA